VIGKFIMAAIAAAAIAAVIDSIPDIKRYIEIRGM
jgi:hypothetical protein